MKNTTSATITKPHKSTKPKRHPPDHSLYLPPDTWIRKTDLASYLWDKKMKRLREQGIIGGVITD